MAPLCVDTLCTKCVLLSRSNEPSDFRGTTTVKCFDVEGWIVSAAPGLPTANPSPPTSEYSLPNCTEMRGAVTTAKSTLSEPFAKTCLVRTERMGELLAHVRLRPGKTRSMKTA